MRKIKEVLRLKFDVGLGLRQIARSCSIGLGTAHEYLHRAEAAKIAWPLGPEWDDDRLEAALFGGPPRSRPTVLARPESTSTITSRSTRTATACLTTSFKNWWRSARRRRSLRSFTRASVWRHTCVHTVMVTPSRLPSTVRVPTKRILNGHRRGWCTGLRPSAQHRSSVRTHSRRQAAPGDGLPIVPGHHSARRSVLTGSCGSRG